MSRVAGFAIFGAQFSVIFSKIPNFSGYRSHMVYVISSDRKTIFQMFKMRLNESMKTKLVEIIEDYRRQWTTKLKMAARNFLPRCIAF